MDKRFLAHLPWITWLTIILVLSFLPGDKLPEIDFTLFELDKLVHFGLYFILAVLMSLACFKKKLNKK